ncbi:MAG TPA: hypothetical protein VGJ87_21320 [Roseiflexaceae bacterium]|jgi:hypothetical protein
MTERQKEPAMPNQRTEKTLSTADMAAAAQQREATPGSEIERMEQDAAAVASPQPAEQAAPQPVQLLATDEAQNLRSRWDAIQTGFVDEPRRAVEQADSLVAEVMQRLAQLFADERSKLEGQWSRGDNVSTEDLRVALQRYRSFFDRLLSI